MKNESNEEVYNFIWNREDDDYLLQLLNEFNLKDIILDSKNELEKIVNITNWVHNLWKHDGSNQPQKSDSISILREVEKGQQFRCVEYSIVINGCLNALGIQSRIVALKTEDVETRESGAGHVVLEAYLRDLDKWIFIDGQWNAITVLNGVPLNSIELKIALAENKSGIEIINFSKEDTNRYFNWLDEYLYYFDIKIDNRVANINSYKGLMLVPKGAKEPKVFQNKWPIENMIYTNSVKAFYVKP